MSRLSLFKPNEIVIDHCHKFVESLLRSQPEMLLQGEILVHSRCRKSDDKDELTINERVYIRRCKVKKTFYEEDE